jgi:hypothetical protein
MLVERGEGQMNIKTLACCVFAIFLAPISSYAQGWRGLVPLHSTCEDVQRILGITQCESSFYELENEIVNLDISKKPCVDGWNVLPGTVLSITVYPRKKPQLSDLHLDAKAYKKITHQNNPGGSYYVNEEEGITVAVMSDEKVNYFTYSPTPKDSHLRYPNTLIDSGVGHVSPHGHVKLDEYGNLPFEEEKNHLDRFALSLQAQPGTEAVIIAYGGRRSYLHEAQARVKRAKEFLISKHRIETARIILIDGGYREESTVELFIKQREAGLPIALPTVCPIEVQIIDQKIKSTSRYSTKPHRKNS